MEFSKRQFAKLTSVLLNKMAEVDEYNLSDEFCLEEIKETLDAVREFIGEEDILNLSEEELFDLGFRKWSEDSNLMLIPLYAYQLIPDGTELISFDGETTIKGEDEIDLDIRFGCIAWGIKPKKYDK